MNNRILSAIRMTTFMLMCMCAVCLTSCSKDEDEGDWSTKYEKKIVGYWVNGKMSYMFSADGTGMLESGNDSCTWGNFKYNLQGTAVYMQVTYMNKYGTVWHDDETGSYNPDDDTFRTRGKVFKRQ